MLVTACGDSNPGQEGGWFYVRLYRDTTEIGKRYISENGKILPSRITSVSQKKQRELSLSIKRARNLALI